MGLVALWHLVSSRTRARTCVPCIGRQILNHCTTREAPLLLFKKAVILYIYLGSSVWAFPFPASPGERVIICFYFFLASKKCLGYLNYTFSYLVILNIFLLLLFVCLLLGFVFCAFPILSFACFSCWVVCLLLINLYIHTYTHLTYCPH